MEKPSEWNKLLDSLAYAYVRGWYDKHARTDSGKIAVAHEEYAKVQLYAAAPELIQALKDVIKEWNKRSNGGAEPESVKRAWKVILKAEGAKNE